MFPKFLLLVGLFGLANPAYAAWRESDESIKSRGEVMVQILVARAAEVGKPGDDDKASRLNPPKDIAVFFPGADGKVRRARAGLSEHGKNPSTMGLMAEKFGMAVAFGLPSDQPDGISVAWRLGAEHIGDAGAVMDWLAKQYPSARITLIGMSNGGRSVTRVADAIVRRGAPKLHGVVVMAAAPEALAEDIMLPIREAQVPVLVLHHKRDSCLLFRDIEPVAKRYTFIAIDDAKQPTVSLFIRSCSPGSAHVFGGKEAMVYSLIADWVQTGKVSGVD